MIDKKQKFTISLKSLQEVGAFTGAPVEKEITWKTLGEEFTATVFVRRLSYKSAMADIESFRAKTDYAPGRIAACICDENGDPVFKPEDITGEADSERGPLDASLTMALLDVIAEVNGLKK